MAVIAPDGQGRRVPSGPNGSWNLLRKAGQDNQPERRVRGTIRGLLPHGPHNVRDVLATHILKQTGSYEQASYAIRTPGHGRAALQTLPAARQDRFGGQILNQVWEAA